jgi:hypothetical protein
MANASELPSVFWFDLTPKAGVAPADLIAALLAQTSSFALTARPNLSPSLFTHRILRGTDGTLAWEVIFSGLDLPGDDDGALADAIASEIDGRISAWAQVSQIAPYVDMQPTAPGRGFARAATVSTPVETVTSGPTAFTDDGGADKLPSWDEYAADSSAAHAGSALPDDLVAEINDARAAMPVESGLSAVGTKGYAYGGLRDTAHLAYLRDYLQGRAVSRRPP